MGLVFEKGVSALSMSAIAGAAGVSRQTLYKYFPDVASVLRAAVQSSSHDTTSIEAEETPADQLTRLCPLRAWRRRRPAIPPRQPRAGPGARCPGRAPGPLDAGARAAGRDPPAWHGRRRVSTDLDPDLDADIVYRTVMALSDLIAQSPDVEVATARAERSILAMVGHERLI